MNLVQLCVRNERTTFRLELALDETSSPAAAQTSAERHRQIKNRICDETNVNYCEEGSTTRHAIEEEKDQAC